MNINRSTSRLYMGYVQFFACMSMILLAIAYYRLSNNGEPVSLVNLLDFVSNHFSAISNNLNNLQIPYATTHYHVPDLFKSIVGVWNNIVDYLNIFTYLLSLVFKVVYTAVSVLIWIITGITI